MVRNRPTASVVHGRIVPGRRAPHVTDAIREQLRRMLTDRADRLDVVRGDALRVVADDLPEPALVAA